MALDTTKIKLLQQNGVMPESIGIYFCEVKAWGLGVYQDIGPTRKIVAAVCGTIGGGGVTAGPACPGNCMVGDIATVALTSPLLSGTKSCGSLTGPSSILRHLWQDNDKVPEPFLLGQRSMTTSRVLPPNA